MSIIKKLIEVQDKLRAPKDQKNTFANYKFRSCESILEAVKPLLKEQELYLSISDTIELIGTRFYVKATVTIETEEGEEHSVSAYAREEDSKKGFDSSQITGASSSYARKYALSGIFAIDDNRDSDATNDHKEDKPEAPKSTPQQAQTNPPKQEVKPKEKALIVVNNDKYQAALGYLEKNGLKSWEKVKESYTISLADEAQLLKDAGELIKSKQTAQ